MCLCTHNVCVCLCRSLIRYWLYEHACWLWECVLLLPPDQFQRDLPAALPWTGPCPVLPAWGLPPSAQWLVPPPTSHLLSPLYPHSTCQWKVTVMVSKWKTRCLNQLSSCICSGTKWRRFSLSTKNWLCLATVCSKRDFSSAATVWQFGLRSGYKALESLWTKMWWTNWKLVFLLCSHLNATWYLEC